MFEQQDFQLLDEDTQTLSEPSRELFREPIHEVREVTNQDDFAKNPKSSSELAAYFNVTKEAIQDWFKIVTQAYCWMSVTELKTGIGKNTRYSSFCIEQMSNLKSSRELGQTASEWIASIHEENANAITLSQTSQQPTPPEVPTASELEATSALMQIAASSSPFSGLAIQAKATEKVENLSIELQKTEAQVEADFAAFMEITAEIINQDEAAELADDLEFEQLRKQNAAKWLRRKAILENDKQQILQGNLASPKQPGNGPVAVS